MPLKLTGSRVQFIAQTFFSLLGAVFSIGMLSSGKDPSIYLPILSGIIGYWVPSPGGSFNDMKKAAMPSMMMVSPQQPFADATIQQNDADLGFTRGLPPHQLFNVIPLSVQQPPTRPLQVPPRECEVPPRECEVPPRESEVPSTQGATQGPPQASSMRGRQDPPQSPPEVIIQVV